MDVTTVIVGIVCFAVAAVVFFVLGNQYRKNVAEKEIGSAEEEAKRIINESSKAPRARSARHWWRPRRKS